MLYTLEAVRDSIRNRDGRRVFYLGKGDQLTSAARDFLTRERIEIRPGEEARPKRYRLPGGGFTEEKPEHMTHLNGETLVCKDHPRILFRGKLDTLEAAFLLCQLNVPEFSSQLQEMLSLAREIMACDVLERPLRQHTLCGFSAEELRRRSHFPQEYYGQPHFMPSASDGRQMGELNRLRCAVRETELAAVTAFQDRDGNPTRPDILQALNRMSSMLYLLMIEQKAK